MAGCPPSQSFSPLGEARWPAKIAPVHTTPGEEQQQSVVALISNLAVRIVRDYTGRGPTRARTYIEEDLVTVVLFGSLSRGELLLVHGGLGAEVERIRRAYQRAMQAELVSGVEELLGRRVAAFLSTNHLDPDVAIESFVLEPK